jgi:hypothetical protein
MRLWHVVLAVIVIAVILVICRDPAGRVAVVVFGTTLGEFFFGTAAILALFRTIGALGEARGFYRHAEAIVATAVVLAVATFIMSSLLVGGVWLLQAATE